MGKQISPHGIAVPLQTCFTLCKKYSAVILGLLAPAERDWYLRFVMYETTKTVTGALQLRVLTDYFVHDNVLY